MKVKERLEALAGGAAGGRRDSGSCWRWRSPARILALGLEPIGRNRHVRLAVALPRSKPPTADHQHFGGDAVVVLSTRSAKLVESNDLAR